MSEVLVVFACLLIGVLLRLSGRMPSEAHVTLSSWVINIALPAAILANVDGLPMSGAWFLAAATPWIVVFLAIPIFVVLARQFGWSRQRLGAVILVGGWGNIAFIGLPMIAAFYDDDWLELGFFIALFGTYLSISTIGIVVATTCAGDKISWPVLVRRIVTFPPLIAIFLALATSHMDRPDWLSALLNTLATTMIPLAMVTIGLMLRVHAIAGRLVPLATVLGYRLFLAPAAITILYLLLGRLDDPVSKVAILEMAMPPMLGASLIAISYDLELELVSLIIGIGVLFSMLTLPLWFHLSAVLS